MQTIPQKFNETAAKFPKRPALKFKYHGAYLSVSFAELRQRVAVMAQGLQSLGVRHGDRVAILSENRTEWVRTDLATLTLGAIVVPVHTTLSPTIIKHILNDSGAKLVVVSNQSQLNKLLLAIDELPALETVVFINLDHPEIYQTKGKQLMSLDEVMTAGERSSQAIDSSVEADDVASIVYTSGTTALPKGVMLTHRNFMFNAEASLTAVPATERDRFLSFLPLSHVLERTCGYYAPLVCRGACIAYAEDIKMLAQNLREIKPTMMISVPRIFEKLHKSIWDKMKPAGSLKYRLFIWALKQVPGNLGHLLADRLLFRRIRAKLGGHLRVTISGGSSLNPRLARFFQRLKITIVEGYGLTEPAPVVTACRLGNVKIGTVGIQLPGVEIKLGPDKEILVHGPNVMKGYYNNLTLTNEVIDADGWFHTGDLGFIDREGFLVIIGRKKEMISLSTGKIVWPEQLELQLNNDRLISQSCVFGNNRSYLVALLVPDWQEVNRSLPELQSNGREPDQMVRSPQLQQLIQRRLEKINDQLADWEKIRTFTLLPREFSQAGDELTPTLKLRRTVIASRYAKEIERMYS